MAVVDKASSGDWVNDDGLYIKFGPQEARASKSGEYARSAASDGKHRIEVIVDLASLPTAASGNEQIQDDGVWLPDNVFIEKVIVEVIEEPTTVGSPNLDFGLVAMDRSTEVDFNGLLAAADAFEAGTDLGVIVEYDTATTEAGVLVGTQFTGGPAYFTASADTADWTDGKLRITTIYSVVLSEDL
jgi:hypothetical protein